MNARFVVAKFIPDLKRMEPRNIGVVVWTRGHTRAKFLGEDTPIPRSIGVKDRKNFKSWIDSWRRELSKPMLEVDRGEVVLKTSENYLDALREYSRGNFILVDGGELLEAVNEGDLNELISYLYRELVSTDKESEKIEYGYEALKATSISAFQSSGIYNRADFHQRTPATYKAYGVRRVFEFDYSLGNNARTQTLFQRVLVSNTNRFDSVLLNLEYFQRSKVLPKDHVASLVMPPKNADKTTTQNIKLLNNVSNVIDLSDFFGAQQQIIDMAAVVA